MILWGGCQTRHPLSGTVMILSAYQVENEAPSGGETRATLQVQSPTNIPRSGGKQPVHRKRNRPGLLPESQLQASPPIPGNPSWPPGAALPIRYVGDDYPFTNRVAKPAKRKRPATRYYTATQLGSHLNPQYPVGTHSTSQLWSTGPAPALLSLTERSHPS